MVTTASQGQEPSPAVLVGDGAKASCHMPMNRVTVSKMGDGIAGETVGSALEQDNLRLRFSQETFGRVPLFQKLRIVRAGRHRDVEFGTRRSPLAGLPRHTSSRIEIAPVFMEVDDGDIGVVHKPIENAVPMMRVNIDVSDTADVVYPAQGFDGHCAVVENAESRRPIPAGVVQTGDGNEGAPAIPVHNGGKRRERRSDDRRRRLVYAAEGGGVAVIEKADAGCRLSPDLLDICRGMEPGQLLRVRKGRFAYCDPLVETLSAKSVFESRQPLRAERVIRTEGIGGQRPAQVNSDITFAHACLLFPPLRFVCPGIRRASRALKIRFPLNGFFENYTSDNCFDSGREQVRGPYKSLFLAFFPLLALVMAALFWLDRDEHRSTLRSIEAQEARRVRVSVQFMTRDFAPVVADLVILADGDPLRDYLASPSEALREKLARHFILFAQERRTFDQIRLLGEDGRERLRVDYRGGRATETPRESLQDKSDRYYFQGAAKLPPGGAFVSPLDLNMEHGRIERPFKPMLRFAAPVYGPGGRLSGVVVLNYLASAMLEGVRERLEEAPGEAMVLNNDGRIMVSRSGRHDWGFMLGDPWSFAERYRTQWLRLRGETGQFLSDAGLFTYASAHPLLEVRTSSEGRSPDLSLHTLMGDDPRAYYWTVLSHIDRDRLKALLDARSQNYLPLYLTGLVMTALLSLSYAYLRVNRQRRREWERLAARVMEVSRDGVLITDGHRRILHVNHAFTSLTGLFPGEVIGEDLGTFHAERRASDEGGEPWRDLGKEGRWRGESWMRKRDGTRFAAAITISPLGGGERGPSNYVEVISDITERKTREEQLTRQAQYDALTGLPNRHFFVDRLEMALASADRHQDRLALLFVDLNKFKPVNDRYGHEVGDRVLREVASRLTHLAHRQSDTVARLGGDEFVVLLAPIDSPERAYDFARQVGAAIERPMSIMVGDQVQVGASVGVAVYPDDASDAQSLIAKADQAMYSIKHAR